MMSKVDAARASGQQTGLKLSRLLVCRERFPGGEPLLQVLLAARSADSTSEMDTEIALASSFKLDRQILGIFVGPEGGFTETEVANMAELSQTFQFVTLGDRLVHSFICLVFIFNILLFLRNFSRFFSTPPTFLQRIESRDCSN